MEVQGLGAIRRTILHLDLDGFYAQVEQVRKGLSPDVPLAVQQWEGIIALNYAAKARGVTRHMRVPQAKEACPDLVLVHVQTIGSHVSAAEASDDKAGCAARQPVGDNLIKHQQPPPPPPQQGHGNGQQQPGQCQGQQQGQSQQAMGAYGQQPVLLHGIREEGSASAKSTSKACLQRYRQASSEIMRVLGGQLAHGAVMEKGGLDEVFIDVTSMVEAQMRSLHGLAEGEAVALQPPPPGGATPLPACPMALAEAGFEGPEEGLEEEEAKGARQRAEVPPGLRELAVAVAGYSVVEGGVQIDLGLESDRRLVVAAAIAKRLRDAVLSDKACGYTCSAGIAQNKMLAKLGSARNKPAQQTLILPRVVAGLMQSLPVAKIRGLGGKLGAALTLAAGGEQTAGAVQALSLAALTRAVGQERARWVFNIVRGMDDEAVKPKGLIKSINSCKSFNPTSNLAQISRWMEVLADELADRMADDEWEHKRVASTLVLHYRASSNQQGPERSVRCAMPSHGREGPSAAALSAAAMVLFRRLPDALPCSRLALSATDFAAPPAEQSKCITRFFSPAPSTPEAPLAPAGSSSTRPRVSATTGKSTSKGSRDAIAMRFFEPRQKRAPEPDVEQDGSSTTAVAVSCAADITVPKPVNKKTKKGMGVFNLPSRPLATQVETDATAGYQIPAHSASVMYAMSDSTMSGVAGASSGPVKPGAGAAAQGPTKPHPLHALLLPNKLPCPETGPAAGLKATTGTPADSHSLPRASAQPGRPHYGAAAVRKGAGGVCGAKQEEGGGKAAAAAAAASSLLARQLHTILGTPSKQRLQGQGQGQGQGQDQQGQGGLQADGSGALASTTAAGGVQHSGSCGRALSCLHQEGPLTLLGQEKAGAENEQPTGWLGSAGASSDAPAASPPAGQVPVCHHAATGLAQTPWPLPHNPSDQLCTPHPSDCSHPVRGMGPALPCAALCGCWPHSDDLAVGDTSASTRSASPSELQFCNAVEWVALHQQGWEGEAALGRQAEVISLVSHQARQQEEQQQQQEEQQGSQVVQGCIVTFGRAARDEPFQPAPPASPLPASPSSTPEELQVAKTDASAYPHVTCSSSSPASSSSSAAAAAGAAGAAAAQVVPDSQPDNSPQQLLGVTSPPGDLPEAVSEPHQVAVELCGSAAAHAFGAQPTRPISAQHSAQHAQVGCVSGTAPDAPNHTLRVLPRRHGSPPVQALLPAAPSGPAGDSVLLSAVDVAEQRRIMHDLQIRQMLALKPRPQQHTLPAGKEAERGRQGQRERSSGLERPCSDGGVITGSKSCPKRERRGGIADLMKSGRACPPDLVDQQPDVTAWTHRHGRHGSDDEEVVIIGEGRKAQGSGRQVGHVKVQGAPGRGRTKQASIKQLLGSGKPH